MKRAGLLLLLACVALPSAVAFGAAYVNDEFRMAVEIPRGTATCRSKPPEHDHGIDVYLDAGSSGCASLASRRYVGLYGVFNAAESDSPEAALDGVCGLLGATPSAAPPGLTIAGLHSASCRADLPDQVWVDVHVAAQSCDRGEEADVNYAALLHTTREHLDADLVRFRAFLNGVDLLSDCVPNPPP